MVFGLVEAEESGITQANVDKQLAESSDPAVLRILGKTEDTGKWLGLERDWMVKAIKATGNSVQARGLFHVLRDIDLQVKQGERIVVCGPSGSGSG